MVLEIQLWPVAYKAGTLWAVLSLWPSLSLLSAMSYGLQTCLKEKRVSEWLLVLTLLLNMSVHPELQT